MYPKMTHWFNCLNTIWSCIGFELSSRFIIFISVLYQTTVYCIISELL